MATIAEQLTSLANTKTAIKDAIVAKGVAVADTDPFSAYPAKIGQISGGGATTKYGVSIDNLLADVEGRLIQSDAPFDFVATGITSIEWKSLAYKFWYSKACLSAQFLDLITITGERSCCGTFVSCQNMATMSMPKLESIDGAYTCEDMFQFSYFEHDIDLPNLKSISGTGTCCGMFQYSYGATGVNLPALTTISGGSVCEDMFGVGYMITSINLPALTTISGSYACRRMFATSPKITRVIFQSLTTIDGSNACQYMFSGDTGLTRADFPALTTITNANAFGTTSSNAIFAGCTGLLEIHFRADAQAVIESLTAYQYKFGATNCTIYFDL